MNRVTLAFIVAWGAGPCPSFPVGWRRKLLARHRAHFNAPVGRWTGCFTNVLTHCVISDKTFLSLSLLGILSVFFLSIRIIHLR